MTYVEKEGNETYVFASDEDLDAPSKANVAEYQEEIDWDCPTCPSVRYMMDSPCAEEFKDSMTYFSKMKNKDEMDEECLSKMQTFMDCVGNHPEYFKSDENENQKDLLSEADGKQRSVKSEAKSTDTVIKSNKGSSS